MTSPEEKPDVLKALEYAQLVEAHLAEAMRRGLPWVKAAQIGAALWPGLSVASAERRVRTAAEASLRIVSSPGSPGYAIAEAVPPREEIEIWNAMISQARKMFRRGWRRRREAYKRLSAPLPLTTEAKA